VIALGLDAHRDDPFGGLAVSTDGFARIGARLGALGLPTVLVQEGGYLCDVLGANLAACLEGFERAQDCH
jgi:acetoin utilization deacetylase AcuC-like enzyme